MQSSLAATKLSGSMGFHAIALHAVCITIFRMGVLLRRSYSATLRSLPLVAKICDSACRGKAAVMRGGQHACRPLRLARAHLQRDAMQTYARS